MFPQKFYDIHFHAMDLSHANITAFTDRFINDPDAIKKLLDDGLPWWKRTLVSLFMPAVGPFLSNRFIARKLTEQLGKLKNVRNLLSFMETSVMYDFLIIEYFLKCDHKNEKRLVGPGNTFNVGGNSYNRIVICPLVMDFGFPNLRNRDIFYNIPPQKPVVSQVSDLFQAIYTYYKKDVVIKNENNIIRFEVVDTTTDRNEKLFEIYPFMGINTINYTIEDIAKMLDVYFAGFSGDDTPGERYRKLNNAMGNFNGDMSKTEERRNIFAGIKLYPPLGFDPWPGDTAERAKVELLYQACADKKIPIITHCSTGGFVASVEHKKYTDPNAQWTNVLNVPRFAKLKIDFAHFGENDAAWTNGIIKMALDKERSIYADFSSNGDCAAYYDKLKKITESNDTDLNDKLLYGSDFMINLLNVQSLNEYMNYFINTPSLTGEQKNKFANANPERFLFG